VPFSFFPFRLVGYHLQGSTLGAKCERVNSCAIIYLDLFADARNRQRSWKPATHLEIEPGSEARNRQRSSKEQKQPKIRRQPRVSFLGSGLNDNPFTRRWRMSRVESPAWGKLRSNRVAGLETHLSLKNFRRRPVSRSQKILFNG
jgi:hypothetical protein